MTRSRSKLPMTVAVAGLLLVAGLALIIYGVVSRRPASLGTQTQATPATAPTAAATAAPTTVATTAPTTAATAAPTAPAARIPVAVSADDFHFRGKWQVVSGMNDGRYAGMSARSLIPGARLIVRFVGHGIRLYGVNGPGGGAGSVAIDGVMVDPDVSFRARLKRPHTLVFASGPLPQGPHRLSVTVNAPAPDRRRGYVNVESAAYDP
ncbi:MAG: hypothetical protein GIX03_05220 [Candidatus Eremiobacteraeota bacterium]|nr:hypothetical protein [Candidatus Eremiobacteraeota bacterium]MBC5802398.1 hypothetical protein [Candidatus Eremiobacteraeota bacterium]MBC5820616.1 hypothetical protein [Candidatus Eremiobacteraeota bacterium]